MELLHILYCTCPVYNVSYCTVLYLCYGSVDESSSLMVSWKIVFFLDNYGRSEYLFEYISGIVSPIEDVKTQLIKSSQPRPVIVYITGLAITIAITSVLAVQVTGGDPRQIYASYRVMSSATCKRKY